jgi:hypothetical protein
MWIIERNFCLNGLMNVLENKVFKPKILNLLPLKIITQFKKCDPFRVVFLLWPFSSIDM